MSNGSRDEPLLSFDSSRRIILRRYPTDIPTVAVDILTYHDSTSKTFVTHVRASRSLEAGTAFTHHRDAENAGFAPLSSEKVARYSRKAHEGAAHRAAQLWERRLDDLKAWALRSI